MLVNVVMMTTSSYWNMESMAGLILSCFLFNSCSAAANSCVLVMTAGGETGCWATASAAVQMTDAISPPLNSNLHGKAWGERGGREREVEGVRSRQYVH